MTQPQARKPPTQPVPLVVCLAELAQAWRAQAAFLDERAAAELAAGKTTAGKVDREAAKRLLACAVALENRIGHPGS